MTLTINSTGIATSPRPGMAAWSGAATLPHGTEATCYASIKSGRGALGSGEPLKRQSLGMFPAVQANDQAMGADERPETGPHPWRPLE